MESAPQLLTARCPACGGLALFRHVAGRLQGACCELEGAPACYWEAEGSEAEEALRATRRLTPSWPQLGRV